MTYRQVLLSQHHLSNTQYLSNHTLMKVRKVGLCESKYHQNHPRGRSSQVNSAQKLSLAMTFAESEQSGKRDSEAVSKKSLFGSGQSNSCLAGLKCLLLMCVLLNSVTLVSANTILMSISTTNSSSGAAASYTINFDRMKNTVGASIAPSSLDSAHIIVLTFNAAYQLSGATTTTPGTAAIDTGANTITLTMTSEASSISVNNLNNPLPSATPLSISMTISNSTTPSTVIDQSETTLTFSVLSFASGSLSYNFDPGNVSTTSNLTLTVTPFIWQSTSMTLKVTLNRYWTENLLNISSNQAVGSLTACTPSCTISSVGSFFIIEVGVNSLTLSSSNTLTLNIANILSPPTLEPADSLTIALLQSTYNSDVQTGTLSIASSLPNSWQSLTAETPDTTGQTITLTIQCVSQDLFGASDTILINMGTPIASGTTVTISNPLVSTFTATVEQNRLITIQNFALITAIGSQFNGNITIVGVQAQDSIKPITNSTIALYRNGYVYDESTFSFAAQISTFSGVTLNLASSDANALTTLTTSITFSVLMATGDQLYISVPMAISVTSCSVTSCSSCTCVITQADAALGRLSSTLTITGFSASGTNAAEVLVGVRNPISSNHTISVASTDADNFTKQTGSAVFPTTLQSDIASSVLKIASSSSMVYATTNLTFTFNLANYSLVDGYMLINFPTILTLPDPTTPFCLVNGNNGQCTITSSGTVVANISITGVVGSYEIVINNLRNPQSTQYYHFTATIHDTNGLVYYTLTSQNYQATTPFPLTATPTSSNCTNSALNTITLGFASLPFTPPTAIISNHPTPTIPTDAVLMQLASSITFSNSPSFTITNHFSLEPVQYQLIVTTADQLYQIFSFRLRIENCQASSLVIDSHSFTGLPQDLGTLSLTITQPSATTPINSFILTFPTQYLLDTTIQSNAAVTTIGPRKFSLTPSVTTNPITLSISNFINAIASPLQLQAYAVSGNSSYLISTNTQTLQYNLTAITSCTSPCKICSDTDNAVCLQCYSSSVTEQYFLDLSTSTCVKPTDCPNTTFSDNATSTCQLCPEGCASCTSTTVCTSCTSFYYLLNETCLTDCPDGYYPVSGSQVCSLCTGTSNTAFCAHCYTLNQCATCLTSYSLHLNNQTCLPNCNSDQISLNSTCTQCYVHCSTCHTTTTNCTSCVSGFFLQGNQCVSACVSPLVPEVGNNICVGCGSTCLTCVGNPSTCTSCAAPLKLLSATCINDCPNGYFSTTDNGTLHYCQLCPSQCTTCTSASNCSVCTAGFNYYQQSCLVSCPISTYQTVSGNVSICATCSSNCLICDNSSSCQACQTNFYLQNNSQNETVCTSACQVGFFLSGSVCEACSTNCLSCISNTVCLSCASPTALESGYCVSSCTTGSTTTVSTSNSSLLICTVCSTLFQNCANCTATQCSQCQSSHILNHNKTCVTACPSGYLNISSVCLTCSVECLTCAVSLSNCTLCATRYKQFNNGTSDLQCLTDCPSNTYSTATSCLSCASPCATCSSNTQCLTCLSGFFKYNTGTLDCVDSCPSASYVFNQQCIQCATDCASCDSIGCLTCKAGFYNSPGRDIGSNTYYDCFDTCPTEFPFLVGNTCQSCSQDCLNCGQAASNHSCYECNGDMVAFQSLCLNDCPPGYRNDTGICTLLPDVSNNATNSTDEQEQEPATVPVPVPFTIVSGVLTASILLSKCIHPQTRVSLSFYASITVVSMLCSVIYMFISLGNMDEVAPPYIGLLVIGVIINYVANLVFICLSRSTLLKDGVFLQWKRGKVQMIREGRKSEEASVAQLQDRLNNQQEGEEDSGVAKKIQNYDCIWKTIMVFGTCTSHNLYVLVFSRLFGLSIFSASLSSVHTLNPLNCLWGVSILSHLLCLGAGIARSSFITTQHPEYLLQIYSSVDLIVLHFLSLLLGFILLRKKSQLWQRPQKTSNDESDSTKKVIFEHDEHNQFEIGSRQGSQEEFNGKIMNLFGQPQQVQGGLGSHSNLIVEASAPSSTNENASQLFGEGELNENLDISQEIKLEDNTIWMQVDPTDMVPQMIQREGTQDELSERRQSQEQEGFSSKKNLQPQGSQDQPNLEGIDPPDEELFSDDDDGSEQGDDWQFDEDQRGDQFVSMGSPHRDGPRNKKRKKKVKVEQQQIADDNDSAIQEQLRQNQLAQQETSEQGSLPATKNLSITPQSDLDPTSPIPSPSLMTHLTPIEQEGAKGSQKQGRRRKKRQNYKRYQEERQSSKNKQRGKSKQSARVSGLAEMFQSFRDNDSPQHASSPNVNRKVNKSPLGKKAEELSREKRSQKSLNMFHNGATSNKSITSTVKNKEEKSPLKTKKSFMLKGQVEQSVKQSEGSKQDRLISEVRNIEDVQDRQTIPVFEKNSVFTKLNQANNQVQSSEHESSTDQRDPKQSSSHQISPIIAINPSVKNYDMKTKQENKMNQQQQTVSATRGQSNFSQNTAIGHHYQNPKIQLTDSKEVDNPDEIIARQMPTGISKRQKGSPQKVRSKVPEGLRVSSSAQNFKEATVNYGVVENDLNEHQEADLQAEFVAYSSPNNQRQQGISSSRGAFELKQVQQGYQTLQQQEASLPPHLQHKTFTLSKINNRLNPTQQQSYRPKQQLTRHSQVRQPNSLSNYKGASRPKTTTRSRHSSANKSQLESRGRVWKSRVVQKSTLNQSQMKEVAPENLEGTAHIIQRKSKLAHQKEQLEHIYMGRN